MKRLLLLVLTCTVLLALAACGTDPISPTTPSQPRQTDPVLETQPAPTDPPEPDVESLSVMVGRHYLNEFGENYTRLGWTEWDSVILSDTDAVRYPALSTALENWNAAQRTYYEDWLQSILPEAQDAAAALGYDFPGYQETASLAVQRADSRILSIRREFENDSGMGVFYGTTCLNLDPATGEAISLNTVVRDISALPRLLEDALKEKYTDYDPAALDGVAAHLESYHAEDYVWTLGYQGMTFHFGVPELSLGERGELHVTVWFEDHPDLFTPWFTRLPAGGYAVTLSQTGANDVDLTPGDGRWDRLSVSLLESGALHISRNDAVLLDESHYGYYMDAYLVTPDGERFYLYVDSSSDNDYRTIFVYDLNGTEPVRIAQLSGDGFIGRWIAGANGGAMYTAVFNDPTRFTLATRTNILGTQTGSRAYAMNPDSGIPEPATNYYTMSADIEPLVSRVELEVPILPNQTTETLPAGTRFHFVRTDNESYMDMRLDDGRECRILVTYEGWRAYVDGMPEEDCFDGLMYAG